MPIYIENMKQLQLIGYASVIIKKLAISEENVVEKLYVGLDRSTGYYDEDSFKWINHTEQKEAINIGNVEVFKIKECTALLRSLCLSEKNKIGLLNIECRDKKNVEWIDIVKTKQTIKPENLTALVLFEYASRILCILDFCNSIKELDIYCRYSEYVEWIDEAKRKGRTIAIKNIDIVVLHEHAVKIIERLSISAKSKILKVVLLCYEEQVDWIKNAKKRLFINGNIQKKLFERKKNIVHRISTNTNPVFTYRPTCMCQFFRRK